MHAVSLWSGQYGCLAEALELAAELSDAAFVRRHCLVMHGPELLLAAVRGGQLALVAALVEE